MSYIKFENIHKNFGENHVLKGIDLNIEKGVHIPQELRIRSRGTERHSASN